MPGAMASSDELRGLPGSASNVLGATVHADLWRLSHLEMQIRQGGAAPGDPTKRARQRRVTKAAERAQRQIRQALFAYVEASVRGTDEARAISKARVAAADHIKGRCPATLRRLRTDWAVRAAS